MYDIKKHENYGAKARAFHKSRITFLILNNEINFLTNSEMSHYEWAKLLGISDEKFNSIIRGYILNNIIVFYKGNFVYDDEVIMAANTYCKEIKEKCNIKEKCVVYCGVKVGEPGDVWPPELFLCEV